MNDSDFNPNSEAHGEENTNFQANEENRDSFTEGHPEEPSAVDSDTEDLQDDSEQTGNYTEAHNDPQPQQPTNPYQQPTNQWQNGQYGNYYGQQPYRPYGQNTPNSQYQQYGQYGQYNPYNSYGSYNSYGQYGQQPQNQNTQYQPYGQQPQNQNTEYQPYGQQYPSQPDGQPPKKKMGGGLKVFLLIIGVLAALFVLGFCIYGIYMTSQQRGSLKDSGRSSTSSSQQLPGNGGSTSSEPKSAVSGNGTDPNSSGLVIENQPSTNELSAKEVYNKVAPSVVSVITSLQSSSASSSDMSQGSGIVATKNGYIITNAHVVNYSKSYQVKVILYNKKQYKGVVVGYDKTTDLAIIKIDANDLTPATFGNADNLSVGDWVMAIGNPAGVEFSSSLTRGIVSALNRSVATYSASGMTYIQTDAAINPGNSGGALVNMYGQVVGINSIKIAATGYEGMGFAIPVSKAKTIIDALISKGYVSGRTRLGITAQTVSESDVQTYGVPQGVAIASVDKDSSLKNSGIVKGDIITKADGKTVASLEELYAVLNTHKPNDTMTLTIYRTGDGTTKSKTFNVTIRLLEDKGETQGTVSSPSSK